MSGEEKRPAVRRTISIPKDVDEAARARGRALNASAVCQKALREKVAEIEEEDRRAEAAAAAAKRLRPEVLKPTPPVVEESGAFVTGSRRYGTPRPESDLDLIVPIGEGELRWLVGILPPELFGGSASDVSKAVSIRSGPLNLILVPDADHLDGWRRGTRILQREGPVSREEAVATFRGIRAEIDAKREEHKLEVEARLEAGDGLAF